jgi:hypothetical protein
MKLPALTALLLTLLFCAAAHCQETEDPDLRELEAAERQMHHRQMQMDLHRHREGKKHKEGWKHKGKDKDDAAPLLIIIAIVHILTAIWVFQDIRKRGVGSGIWIVLALLTGLLGTLVYAIVRLGNTPQPPR